MHSEQPVLARRGMVATAHYLATQAGLQILTQGGNAMDAAIAANAVMTVVYPAMCSAGGDLFILLWDAQSQQVQALNGSGRASGGLVPEYFAARSMTEIPARGPLAISVPGAVDGWFTALERYGSLPAETVFAPAIELAEEGFVVSPKLANWLKNAAASVLGPWESSRKVFFANGRTPEGGEILRMPGLAATYRLLAREGRDAFYRGPIGRAITDYVQQSGGVLSMQDLAAHHSDWVSPISTSYRGHDIYEFPPNSQGIAALEMLNIMEGYDLQKLGYQTPEYLHILLEAKKLAFADRDRYITDPAFADIPLERLLSKKYAEEQRARIQMQRAAVSEGEGFEKEGDTMYLCTVDRNGNAISLIQSLYNGFGSGLVGGDTGVLLQNRASYFSLDPRHVNYLQPGKRTMHTLTPALVLRDGKPAIVLGSMGGDAQPQIHVQLLSAMIDFGQNAQQAVSAPRWRSGRFQMTPGAEAVEKSGQAGIDEDQNPRVVEAVHLEGRLPEALSQELKAFGHRTTRIGLWEDGMGHAQVIVIHPETRILEGAADPRCDGLALGW